jgi:hypothetical protein
LLPVCTMRAIGQPDRWQPTSHMYCTKCKCQPPFASEGSAQASVQKVLRPQGPSRDAAGHFAGWPKELRSEKWTAMEDGQAQGLLDFACPACLRRHIRHATTAASALVVHGRLCIDTGAHNLFSHAQVQTNAWAWCCSATCHTPLCGTRKGHKRKYTLT